ncbi:MAG: 3-isopropylmalate dehydratase large subunit, partial [Armatimonadetes bacterium]|nr:3-isopropylmalate dehydratase large subunit [Armatimonadota bacterium]
HTCTYGALGAFATGVGSTDFAAGMALGECWFRVPASLKFVFSGQLSEWVSGKDLILYTIGQIGVDGARYMAMEFAGPVIEQMDMAGRFTICNMAIEAGAKNGIIAPDDITLDWVKSRAARDFEVFSSDEDAQYAQVYEWDVGGIEPQVAFPHLPENVRGISEVGDITIDQAVIGACTNGRLEDLRVAAEILEGRQVADGVRCIVIPGSQQIHLQATTEGLVETFLEAGCLVSTPTCGPCLGGHMGVLATGERAIATTNRNFVGRMGHPESEVYLASPAVAAASAVTGRICGPREL